MCEQCLVNPLYYGEVFKDWHLIRARRKGSYMEVGEWGLVKINDPSWVWKSDPRDQSDGPPDDFWEAFLCTPFSGKEFIEDCVDSGFDGENDYDLSEWLWEKIVNHVKTTPPATEEDPFPNLDSTTETDYTL